MGEFICCDFLYLVMGMVGVVGVVFVVWLFIDQMWLDVFMLVLVLIEVDVIVLMLGMLLMVKWCGKLVFICNWMDKEVQEVVVVKLEELKDLKVCNQNFFLDVLVIGVDCLVGKGKENWIVMIGLCMYLGCVLFGQVGEYGGWFCFCYGLVYDMVGCICKGFVLENLVMLIFLFIKDIVIKIG